ncbi:carbohydrate kinase family protein [Leifsonia sp. NPDC056665]|uniref:carbohydrate kinase family protein n=1 Tax=Leifsonia sp. NPDC056665 TaxID=3345901 RepID=UPI0036CC0E4F
MIAAPTVWTVGHLTVDDVMFWNGPTHFRSAGGAALYAGIGASLFGAAAKVATRLGDGFPTEELERLRRLGVELVPTGAGEPCISEWVLYEEDGSRKYVLHPNSGSLERMSPSPKEYGIPSTAAVHIAPMPIETQAEWCRSERGRHRLLTVDPHHDSCALRPDDVLATVAGVDAFLPSELEARLLSGDDPVQAIRTFREAGAPIAVVKLGSEGSVVGTAEGIWHVPVVPVRPVDVTGAGDSYCGAFAAALAAGLNGLDAACAASAVASIVVEARGAAIDGSVDRLRSVVVDRIASIEPALISGDPGGALITEEATLWRNS